MEDAASQAADAGTGNGTDVVVDKPTWIEQLPEDMRGNEGLYKYQTIGDLAKSYGELSTEREGLLKVPGEDATDEDRNAFYSKMGVPETPDAYEIGKPAEMPEGMEYSEELETWYRGFAHQNHLSSEQAKSMFDGYNQMMGEAHTAMVAAEKAAIEKAENTLKDAWPGDTYAENKEIAHRGFLRFSGEGEAEQKEAHDFINNTIVDGVLLGDHPAFQKLFHRLGVQTSDDNANAGKGGVGGKLSEEDKAKEDFPNTKYE